MTSDFVRSQINRLNAVKWGTKISPDNNKVWIRCPFHGNGEERTPSFIINLEDSPTDKGIFKAGSGHCYACGVTLGWKKIADKLNLKAPNANTSDEKYPEILFNAATDEALINDEEIMQKDLDFSLPWPKDRHWRGINGKLVSKVGGSLFFDSRNQIEALYFSVVVNYKKVGGVKANIVKMGRNNYFNDSGSWVKDKGLFPYDNTKIYIKRKKLNTVVLVEGSRDALNCLQRGIPAIAILGTGNWSDVKADLVLNLGVSNVILAFDPDEAGDKATKVVFKSLKNEVSVKKFTFPPNIDPGAMKKDIASLLKGYIK